MLYVVFVVYCAEVRTIVVFRKPIMEMAICAEALIGVRSFVEYKNKSAWIKSGWSTVFCKESHAVCLVNAWVRRR